MGVRDYIEESDFNYERCSILNEWWYVRTLTAHSKDLPVIKINLASIDLDVMPWEITTIFNYIDHSMQVSRCSSKYPIIMSPAGWIMNGWHRVVKAILDGKETIDAVRFVSLPTPDGNQKLT